MYYRLVLVFVTAMLSACGGGGATYIEPEATPVPTATPEPDDTSALPGGSSNLPDLEEKSTLPGQVVEKQFTVTGIDQPVSFSVSGGEYSVNGGAFTSEPATVEEGDVVTVRVLAASEFATTVTARITSGSSSFNFNVTTVPADTSPDEFLFSLQRDVELASVQTSPVVFVSGINTPVSVSISNGEYALDNGEYTSSPGTITNGQAFRIRLLSSNEFATQTSAAITVGDYTTTFSALTRANIPAPELVVVFPRENSMISRPMTTVRGTAINQKGIQSVTVNGSEASILPYAGLQEIEWSADVYLSPGDNYVTISSVDGTGERSGVVSYKIRREVEIPIEFSVDYDNNRVIGIGPQSSLVSVSLSDGSLEHIAQLRNAGGFDSSCLRSATGEFYYAAMDGSNFQTYNILSYNLNTGESRSLGAINTEPEILGYDNNLISSSFKNLVCDSKYNSLYGMVNYRDINRGVIHTIVYRITLEEIPVISVFLETGDQGFENWIPHFMGYDSDGLVTNYGVDLGDIQHIDLNDKTVTTLIPGFDHFNFTLTTDLASDRIFYVTASGIESTHIQTFQEVLLSYVPNDSPLSLPQSNDIEYISELDRLLVSDRELNALIQVNVATGERSILAKDGLGEGPPILSPNGMVMNASETKVYLVDSGGNAGEKILEIDLATGDRRKLGNINGSYNYRVGGIALDESANIVYASVNDVIFAVDVETERQEIIASSSVGTGAVYQDISDLILDKPNNRLLFIDGYEDALFSVNLTTKVRSLVSKPGVRGEGEAFDNPVALELQSNGDKIYIAAQLAEIIVEVDLETGNRERVIDSCVDSTGNNYWSNFESMQNIKLDRYNNYLYIMSDTFMRINLATGQCEGRNTIVPNDVVVTHNNSLLIADWGNLGVLDFKSGARAVISK